MTIFLCGILCKLLSFGHEVPITPDYSKTPILFVHGAGLTSKTWNKMIKYLISIGYPPPFLFAVDLIPRHGSNIRAASVLIEPAAAKLLEQATVAARKAGYQKRVPQRLDIVSHSMGAVSSRLFTTKIHPEQVRTWISIAGSNHGTNALFPFLHEGEGNREMCPAFATNSDESDIQIVLNGTPNEPIDETPYGIGQDKNKVRRIPPDDARQILYLTIRIEPDRWIKPENSAILDGAGGVPIAFPSELPIEETSPGNYLLVKKIGHDSLPKNSHLIRAVAFLISASDKINKQP